MAASAIAMRTASFRKVFWSAGFGWMFDAMDVGLLSFILVMLRSEWGLTAGQAGWLGTVNMAGMAAGALLGGWLADRYGRKPVFLYTLLLFGAASVGSAFAGSFAVMLVFRFVMGLGLGAELPVASTLVNEFAPEDKRGQAVVLLESFWAAGWIAAAVISYFVMPQYGWRTAVIIGAIPLLYALFIRRSIPESPQFVRSSKQGGLSRLIAAYRRETIALWSVWFAISFAYYGMFLWLPSVLTGKGYSLIQSFAYVLLMTLAQLPGYFAAAWMIERLGRKPTLALFIAMTAVAAAVFGASESLAVLLTSGAFLSFFNLGAWGALYAYTPENYPSNMRASGSGAASAFGRIGSIIAPLLVGIFTQNNFSYGVVFGIFTGVLLAGAAVLLMLGKETKTAQ